MVSADSRNQNDPEKLKFCGASALSAENREEYAVLMRIAMLSALEANYTTANLGFRCAAGAPTP
jgi:formylglycine-generating enzyme required for sulfatase activity